VTVGVVQQWRKIDIHDKREQQRENRPQSRVAQQQQVRKMEMAYSGDFGRIRYGFRVGSASLVVVSFIQVS
jgi:hypothetical protein